MNGLYIFLIAIVCSPVVGLAQNEDETERHIAPPTIKPTATLPIIRYDKQKATNLAMSFDAPKPKHNDNRAFPTHPMPNGYRGDNAVPMPNAYRGDNCVPMPNVYGGILYGPLDSVSAEREKGKFKKYDRSLDSLDSITIDSPNVKPRVPKK